MKKYIHYCFQLIYIITDFIFNNIFIRNLYVSFFHFIIFEIILEIISFFIKRYIYISYLGIFCGSIVLSLFLEKFAKQKFKKYANFVYFILIWGMLLRFRLTWDNLFTRIICSAGVLGIGWGMILLSYNFFRKNVARIILFISVSIFGIGIYEYYDNGEKQDKNSPVEIIIKMANDVNNTLSSFFPSRGDIDLNELLQKQEKYNDKYKRNERIQKTIIILYVIYHSTAYLVFGIFTMSIWGRRLANYSQYLFSIDHRKYVLWGKNLEDNFFVLGKDIYDKKLYSKVVIALLDDCLNNNNDENKLYDQLNNRKLSLIFYNTLELPFESLFSSYHFFISHDEVWNLNACSILLNERKKYGIKSKIDIYIRFDDKDKFDLQGIDNNNLTDINEIFLNGLKSSQPKENNIQFHVFKESELIARKFINMYPTILTPSIRNVINHETAKLKEETRLKILLLGFGGLGKKLLSYIVEDSQFLTDNQSPFISPLYVDIYDKQEETFDLYRALRSDACWKYHLNFEACDVLSSDFYYKMSIKLCEYDRIIISLGDDTLNMRAFDLIRNLKKIYKSKVNLEIFVKQNQLLYNSIHVDSERDAEYIYEYRKNIFGVIHSIYTSSIILDEEMDDIAISMNFILNVFMYKKLEEDSPFEKINSLLYNDHFINKYKNDIMLRLKLWNELNEGAKQATRSIAANVKNILYLLGYKIAYESASNDIKDLKRKIENNAIKACLAEYEHNRWVAYMMMKGIRPWIINEHTTKEEAAISNFKMNQISAHNRHGGLVDFKQLPYVEKILDDLYNQNHINTTPYTCIDGNPSKFQCYDYFINLFPIALEIAGIGVKKIES